MAMRPYVFVCVSARLFRGDLRFRPRSGLTKKEKVSRIRSDAKRDSQAIPSSPVFDRSRRRSAGRSRQSHREIGTQYSLDPLIKATHDNDPGVQIRAVDGLVNFYLPRYVTTGGVTKTFTRVGKRIKTALTTPQRPGDRPEHSVRPDVIEAIAAVIPGGSSVDSRSNAARAAGSCGQAPPCRRLKRRCNRKIPA